MRRVLFLFLLMSYFSSLAQSVVFSGNVFDSENRAVVKATITILNTDFITSTDEEGFFFINQLPKGNYTLQIKALGYANYTKEINHDIDLKVPLKIYLDDEDTRLNEVIVTAQKREENIKEVPISITTLSSGQIVNQRIWNSRDLSAIVPNLYSSNPGDNRNVTSIRGIFTTSYDQAVATYIDGVSQFGLDTYIAQLIDVERIEVLRGPQGTLYGRNAMGGVINIITTQPENKVSGHLGVDIGNYNQQRYNFALRTPLIADKLFFGAAGLYTESDGFYTNKFNNSKFDLQNNFVGNYYLKLLSNSKLSFSLNVKHNSNKNNGPFTLTGSPDEALQTPFIVNQNAQTNLIDRIFNSSLSVNYYGEYFSFNSQTAYQNNYRYYVNPIDGDFSPIDGVTIINNYGKDWNKVKVITQEIRISSPASTSKFKWLGGFYGFYQDNPVKQGTHFGKDAIMIGAPFPDFTTVNTNKSENLGAAVFGNINYKINSKLSIGLGMRYDYEYRNLNVLGEFLQEGQETIITQADTSSNASFHASSPKVNLSYAITSNHYLYTSYSKGFRAGGISQLSSDPSEIPLNVFQPEYSNNIEIGTKNTFFKNRLIFNASAFYTNITNVQVPELVLPDAITVTRNTGKITSKGIEAELTSLLFKDFELNYNFGFTDARYSAIVTEPGNTISIEKGNKQIFTPEITSFFAFQYAPYILSNSNKLKLLARGEWKYLGSYFFDSANTIRQGALHLFNTRLGVATSNLEVFLWGNNLSNKTYIDYAYSFGATRLGNPRTYGISFMKRF